jgi:hypothetical protein
MNGLYWIEMDSVSMDCVSIATVFLSPQFYRAIKGSFQEARPGSVFFIITQLIKFQQKQGRVSPSYLIS